MNHPLHFGVRHLSPAGAWHLRRLLARERPRLVLVEGPADLTELLRHLVRPETAPPVALLAYSATPPIRIILYPLAEYSPEYQAVLWAHENRAECRLIDLPSGNFLALQEFEARREEGGDPFDPYRLLDELSGEDDHETFWEHVIEHATAEDAYLRGAGEFGAHLRELAPDRNDAVNVVREAYMKREIARALAQGFAPGEIVVVTGSYHVAGLRDDRLAPMTDAEYAALPKLEAKATLMPYSDYRLSARSGYGAGNKAPAYYRLLWEGLQAEDLTAVTVGYLSRIAAWQRSHGNPVSAAEVIEAVRLAPELARLHGFETPSLADLRDAAVTCLGHGNPGEIALAVADTEIGTRVGSLPEGVVQTCLQEDFNRQLKDLRLEKYKSVVAETLSLDLREKLTVKSEKAANLDLERSFFLHRLRLLGNAFANYLPAARDRSTWGESWQLRWTPEAEIELVESALKGDTLLLAASFALKERLEAEDSIASAASVIEDAALAGMPEAVGYATSLLQRLAADAAAVGEIARCAASLSAVLQFGNIRRLDPAPLEPLLDQLFLRGTLLLEGASVCDNQAAAPLLEAIETLNRVSLRHEELENDEWLAVLGRIARRDDLNPIVSGFTAAILLERGAFNDADLDTQVRLRLSRGMPADLGSAWFEGLSRKNRHALIARLGLWRALADYLGSLDDEELKRALLFLRRAFADYAAKEKNDIAENLGEIWGINPEEAADLLNRAVTADEKKMLEGLDDFDFSDL